MDALIVILGMVTSFLGGASTAQGIIYLGHPDRSALGGWLFLALGAVLICLGVNLILGV